MKLKFVDETEVNIFECIEGKDLSTASSGSSLRINLNATEMKQSDLKSIMTPSNLAKLIVINENLGQEIVYHGYTILSSFIFRNTDYSLIYDIQLNRPNSYSGISEPEIREIAQS